MPNLCLNSRDELLIIDVDKIAYLQADGNYTRLTYIGSQQLTLSMSLSKVEKMLAGAVSRSTPGAFIRLGRSLIINQTFLTSISTLKQRVVLSDGGTHVYSLPVPKDLAKEYKNKVAAIFASVN